MELEREYVGFRRTGGDCPHSRPSPFAFTVLAELPYRLFSAEGQQCVRTNRRTGDNEGNFMMTEIETVLATILGREGHPLVTVMEKSTLAGRSYRGATSVLPRET